jgi:hypothetical protein
MVGICRLCSRPYRTQERHVKDSHRMEMWYHFDQEHPMRPGYCDICKKPIRENLRRHAIKKHLGMAAREFVRAGMLK